MLNQSLTNRYLVSEFGISFWEVFHDALNCCSFISSSSHNVLVLVKKTNSNNKIMGVTLVLRLSLLNLQPIFPDTGL